DRLVIRFGGSKLGGELSGCEELVILRTGRVVKLLEQSVQRRRVAQRKADRKGQLLRFWQLTCGLQTRHHRWHMPLQLLQRASQSRPTNAEGRQEKNLGH